MSRAIVEMMRNRPGGGTPLPRAPEPSGQWKVVWSNGDEVHVEADCKSSALTLAAREHGETAAHVIHCARYG